MASANFRLGAADTDAGPWTWGGYDCPIDVTAGQIVKIELESTSGVKSVSIRVTTADEVTLADLPNVIVDQSSKTGVFVTRDFASTYIVWVQINGGKDPNDITTKFYEKKLAVHVKTSAGLRLLAVGETDEADRTAGYAAKINTLIRNGGGGGSAGANAFATTTATFAMPGGQGDDDASVTVDSAAGLGVNEVVQAVSDSVGSAFMRITSISGTTVGLQNLYDEGTYQYLDNLHGYQTMPVGTKLIPSGVQGPQGVQGDSGAQGIPGSGQWQALTATSQFATTAASSSSLTMTADLTSTLKPGYAFKVVDGGATKWFVVNTVASNLVTLYGPALSLTVGAITAVSWADCTRVKPVTFSVAGAFAIAASSTLLASYCKRPFAWLHGPARVCLFRVRSSDQSTTAPKVNLTIGGTAICSDNSNAGPAVAATWKTGTLVNAALALTQLAAIELTTTQGATTGTPDANLSVDLLTVLE